MFCVAVEMLTWKIMTMSVTMCSILQEVGMPADYVNKLARMFQDIKVSEDLNQEFKDAHRNNNEYIAGIISFLCSILGLMLEHTYIKHSLNTGSP